MRVLILSTENHTIKDIKEEEASATPQDKPEAEAKQKTEEKQMTADQEEEQVATDRQAEQTDVENTDNSQQQEDPT
jgi:hypothetical protein